jgi:hypothetical protein
MTEGGGPAASTPPTEAATAYAWLLRAVGGKFGSLLIALVALLLSAPVIIEGWGWNLLLSLFASAMLLAGLQAARPGRRSFRIGLALAAADLGIGRLVFIAGTRWLVVLQAALWLAALIYVTVTILDAVFTRKSVDVETLQAALCVYLLLGLIWVWVYALIALAEPGSFRSQGVPQVAWTDAPSRRAEFMRLLVFSYSTLTSSGLGDFTTGNSFASICANLEALTAQIYLAVVIARLVGLQAASPPQ